jgi:arylsulfatase A-like enzyme
MAVLRRIASLLRVVATALVLASLWLPPVRGAMATDSRPPNILFIFADDLTCQALSTYGESRHLLDTPNIDRLAREGMQFDRCLVTNSICGPSRATILTGKYSHKNGFSTTPIAGSTRPNRPSPRCFRRPVGRRR